MAEFKESQKKYTEAKNAYRQASTELYLARQQQQIVEKKIVDFLKTKLLTKLPAAHELNKLHIASTKKLTKAEAAFVSAKTALDSARTEFNNQGTANQTTGNLNDSIPILLLPLRLQTRFLTIKHVTRNLPEEVVIDFNKLDTTSKEKIVSVFPAFKETTDPLRPKSSQAFSLSHGSSTTRVINELHETIKPQTPKRGLQKVEDKYELWVRVFPDDIFLQSHESALTENELAAAKTFWQAMWDAEREFHLNTIGAAAALKTKTEKQLETWKALRFQVLPHRANWIARIMRPADYPDNFPIELDKIPEDKFPNPGVKSDSWTIPPATDMLPENFIVKIFFKNPDLASRDVIGAAIPDYVQLGFDPDEKDENAFSEKDKVLELPAAIRWLTDISEAEKAGMAVRIPLSAMEFISGISKLVVVGIKTGADETEGSRLLTRLLDNHHYKPDGMAFLPHGTATNNLPGQSSGFSQAGISDEQSFNNEFPTNIDNDAQTDGRRLATALGLNENAFINIFNHSKHEGQEALMLNDALWTGTLGYYLDNHLRPNVTDADISFTKTFFLNFVTGRGLLPSFRVGKQPYGIIPSTSWSAWNPDTPASPEEIRLVKFLKKMDNQWAGMVNQVKTMKKVFQNTDEQQLKKDFRELLAYQASSTRFFRRMVAGEYLLWNVNQMSIPLNTEKAGITTTPNAYKSILESVSAWNEPVNPRPQILGKFFDDDNYKLTDLPPDVASGLNRMNDKGANYISILLDATFEQLKTNSFGEDFNTFVSQRSSRLMFYLARFSLLQAWVEAATGILRKEKPEISPLARLDFEMEYIIGGNNISHEHSALLTSGNIPGSFETRKNKWSFFEQVLSDGTTVENKILLQVKENLSVDDPVKNLQDVRNALTELSTLPVERLERLFSEHIDLCSFRLDAWLQGLALSRLFGNRKKQGFEKGIFIGSFGYVENLTPGPQPWVQVKEIATPQIITTEEAANNNVVIPIVNLSNFSTERAATEAKFVFAYLGSDTATFLTEDPITKKIIQTFPPGQVQQGGYVLTPSLEHAATAGILRAGYEHHAISAGPESKTLAVNIGSERTGWAIDMLKGVKAGHSLNEQLGYFIERRMYDNLALAQFIPALRLAFPLHIERNEWDDDQQIGEADKISNLALVTDGLAIVNKNQNPTIIPTWNDKLTAIFLSDDTAKIDFGKIVEQAIEQFDAVSDLVLAESVYQTVKGSPERAAAALRMTGEGSDITLPEVVSIPAENRVLTHRVGFVLNAGSNLENAWPAGAAPTSIFARLSPALNRWLADQLPAPNRIIARIITTDNAKLKVGILSTGIQAIDLFYLLQKTGLKAKESLLSWLFTEAAKNIPGIDSKKITGVSFDRDRKFSENELSISEILPLIKSIGSMLEQSRPMRPEDFQLMPNNASSINADLYDNSLLKTVCGEFADNSISGPINLYLEKLTNAKTALEQNFPIGFGSPESDRAFSNLIRLIPQAFLLGVWDATPRCLAECNPANANILLDQALHIIEQLTKRIAEANFAFSKVTSQDAAVTGDKIFDMLAKIAKQFAGEDFIVLPKFSLPDPASIKATFKDKTLASSIGEFGVEEWLQSLSMVRDSIRRYQVVNNLRAVFKSAARERHFKILQLPFIQSVGNNWIGVKFPEGFQPPPQATSMAYEFSTAFNVMHFLSGMIIDDWREKVPLPELTAGISINYDQSNSEPPQCLLLLVTPELKGGWEWQAIVNSVIETMTLAKKRAVDVEIIQTTWLSQFLPALVTPLDAKNNTPNLDFRWAGPAIRPIVTGDIGGDIGGGVFVRV